MTEPTPSPETHVLRLKNQKTTVFLYCLPTSTIASLKPQLYEYLSENALHLQLESMPSELDDIVFAVPKDAGDYTKGFYPLEESKKKGKGGGGNTIKEAGLKDGDVVAWKIKGEGGEWEVDVWREEEEEEDGEEEIEE